MITFVVFSTAPNDYSASTHQLTFQPGITQQCADISIVEDVILENDEMFTVLLNTTDQAVVLSTATATIIITDNDSEFE